MSNSSAPVKKSPGWRFTPDLIDNVLNIAERDGRSNERVAADALRAGLLFLHDCTADVLARARRAKVAE